jgi:hypothetical protein
MKRLAWFLFATLIAPCPLSFGQSTFGKIVGSVTDSSGAVVPGAQVTLTSLSTTEKRSVAVSGDGLYEFVNLSPGQYRIDVEQAGFEHFTRTPITVEVDQEAHIDVGLQVGQVSQTVEVTAQTPLLQPETSSLGQVIETRQVNELPLNGRNPMNLVALAPSVVPQGQSQGNPVGKNPFDYANYQLGGAVTNQGAEYLDGVPLNNSYANELSLIPTQDSLQEFKVQTNNLGADWGRFAGGVINFSTKSGSNDIHGAAYEYLRNTVLNADNFFDNANGVPRAPYHQNQFGFNVGGPVFIPHVYDGRDKSFFFFSYEGFRQSVGQTFVESVPTLAEKGGDFSNYKDSKGNVIPIFDPTTTVNNGNGTYGRQQISCNGASNVICPGIIANNPAVQFMLSEFPTPNAAGTQFGEVNNFVSNSSGGGRNNEVVVRGDQRISDKQHLSLRYTRWTNLNLPIDPFGTGVCQDRCTETFTTHNAMIDDVFDFSPTTIMDLRLSWGRLAYDRVPADVGIDLSKLGPNWAPLNSQVVLRDLPIPTFGGAPDGFLGNVFSTQGAGSVITARDDTPRIAGSLTHIMGRHTIQIGGEFRVDHHNYLQTNTPVGMFGFTGGFTQVSPSTSTLANGQATGSAFASFLLGYGNNITDGYVSPVASQQIYPALYMQDQFKVTSKLTLNLGGRWEQNGPYSERYNRVSVLQPNGSTGITPPCVALPSADATALSESQLCEPALNGALGIVASNTRSERYAQNKPWLQFSPHVGFAYQLGDKTVVRGGYGLFWISNAVEFDETPNTDGVNSIGTPWVNSADGGLSPCLTPSVAVGQQACPGSAASGATPTAGTFNLSNPFPNGIVHPPGRDIALYQSLQYGNGPFALLPNNPFAYYQQWNFDVQRALPDGTLIDLAYAAAKGNHLPDFSQQLDALPDKYLSLGSNLISQVQNPFVGLLGSANHTTLNTSPTVQLQQLLLPYPQYTGYSIGASGWSGSDYNSLQVKLEKRMRGSGTLLVSYTVSKMLTTGDVDSLTSWLETTGAAGIQDWNNRANEKSLSSYDVPQRLVASYVLDLPVGRGRKYLSNASGVGGKLISGWGAEGVTTYQRGFPLNFGFPSGSATGENVGMRPDKNGAGALSGSPETRLSQWFDASAFSAPANYSFGSESRVDPTLRSQGIQDWDFSLFKDTRFGPEDRMGLQFRAEFFNIFNKPQFAPPNTTCCTNTNGAFGVINSTLGGTNPRLIQFALRFTF